MAISRKRAIVFGAVSILGIVAIQAFNSFACYSQSPQTFLVVLGTFLLVPLLPAIISLFTANPLRAVGACLLFAPWLVLAYYTDCVRPYTGGGASMSYVGVLFWGTPSSIFGALVTGPILRMLGIAVEKTNDSSRPRPLASA
jgi:hypothetical protein